MTIMSHSLSFSCESESRLLEALASLNQISGAINRIGAEEVISSTDSLQLIVESAIRVVPGSSAVIYTYDERRGIFERESRVAASLKQTEGQTGSKGQDGGIPADDFPRPNGIGTRAIQQRRILVSYEQSDVDVHPYHAARGVKVVGAFPLIVADQRVGVLYIYLHEARPFTRLELLMLENFANQAAMTIYHTQQLARMRRNLARKEEELRHLRRAGMLISSRLKLEETLEAILQLALEMTDAHYGIFRLLDKSGKHLVTHVYAGDALKKPRTEAIPLDSNSIMAYVARTRQSVLIHDLQSEPWVTMYYPLDTDLHMRSELAVPLIDASGRLEGVLNLESPEVGAFDEDDRHLLEFLGIYAVNTIQEMRLLNAVEEASRRLFSQPYEQVLAFLTEAACDLLNVQSSALWLRQENELVLAASTGGVHSERLPLEGSLAGLAVLSREAVISDDVANDPRFYRHDLAKEQGWRRALIVPLLGGEEKQPIGAFGILDTLPTFASPADLEYPTWRDWDRKVLTFLAHYAVLTVQKERHQRALRAAEEQHSVAEMFAAMGDIASNLLHYLNNKVGMIPVRVQSIQEKRSSLLEEDSYLARNLEEIQRCAMEAMQTVRENLFHLHPIWLEPTFVSACLNEAIHSIKLPAEIEIRIDGIQSLPPVVAARQSLIFVFANLLENASDAMQGRGLIEIRGQTKADWIEITVSDSGPGIPPALADRIFELNFSGRNPARPGKLGFGLWWIKMLMTRLGGSIELDLSVPRGASFRLRLPRYKEAS